MNNDNVTLHYSLFCGAPSQNLLLQKLPRALYLPLLTLDVQICTLSYHSPCMWFIYRVLVYLTSPWTHQTNIQPAVKWQFLTNKRTRPGTLYPSTVSVPFDTKKADHPWSTKKIIALICLSYWRLQSSDFMTHYDCVVTCSIWWQHSDVRYTHDKKSCQTCCNWRLRSNCAAHCWASDKLYPT